jgi:hypothetical protein
LRGAHRNGLLMGAPELSDERRAACGPGVTWRADDEEDPNEAPRAGTEVYDALDDGDDDDGDDDRDDDNASPLPMSIHGLAARARSPAPPRLPGLPGMSGLPGLPTGGPSLPGLPPRQKTEVERFAGVELTSIINMMDLDDQGSRPLVDLNIAPTIDSGPRVMDLDQRLDSDPALNAFVSSLPPTMMGAAIPPAPPPRTGERPQFAPPPPHGMNEMVPSGSRRGSTAGDTVPRQQYHGAKPAPRFTVKLWMVILALLAIGLVVTLVVALSGPDLPGK